MRVSAKKRAALLAFGLVAYCVVRERPAIADMAGSGRQLPGADSGFVSVSQPTPNPAAVPGSPAMPYIDPNGHLFARGQALTDEGSFRDDFNLGSYADGGVSLANFIPGTITMTSGSKTVTGSGSLFTQNVVNGQFIDIASDCTSTVCAHAVQVAQVLSDTSLTLVSNASVSGTGVVGVVLNWQTAETISSTLVVNTSSLLTMTAVQQSASRTQLISRSFNGPVSLVWYGSVTISSATTAVAELTTQGNGNGTQEIDTASITFSSLTVNQITLAVSNGTLNSAGQSESKVVTLPAGAATNATQKYGIYVHPQNVTFTVNDQVMWTFYQHIPLPYTPMAAQFQANGNASSTAVITLDTVYITQDDRLEVSTSNFTADPPTVKAIPAGLLPSYSDSSPSTAVVTTMGDICWITAPVVTTGTGIGDTVRVTRVSVVLSGNASAYDLPLALVKRPVPNTWDAGNCTAMVETPMDSTDAVAQATSYACSQKIPAPGDAGVTLATQNCAAESTTSYSNPAPVCSFPFGDVTYGGMASSKPITLRNGQTLAVSLVGAAVPDGGFASCTFSHTEGP